MKKTTAMMALFLTICSAVFFMAVRINLHTQIPMMHI